MCVHARGARFKPVDGIRRPDFPWARGVLCHRRLYGRRAGRVAALALRALYTQRRRVHSGDRVPGGAAVFAAEWLYLAMATLGFTLIVQEMLLQLAVITHGSEGMSVPPAAIAGFVFKTDYRKYYLLLGVTVVMFIVARNLIRGRTGRAFLAIRDNERQPRRWG